MRSSSRSLSSSADFPSSPMAWLTNQFFSQKPSDPNKILEISSFLRQKKDGSLVIKPVSVCFSFSCFGFFRCKSPMLRVYGQRPFIFPSQMKPLFLMILAYSSLLEGRWFPEKRMALDLSFLYVAQHLDIPTLEITICSSFTATSMMLQPALDIYYIQSMGKLYFALILFNQLWD